MVALANTQPNMWTAHVEVQHGDVWQLGRHRIACLNALEEDTYGRLLQDTKIHAIIADPPYGIKLNTDYTSKKPSSQFIKDKGMKGGKKYEPVAGDNTPFDASFFLSRFSDVKEQFWFGADNYARTLGDTEHTGAWLVWDKRELEQFDRMFGSGFELIWSRKKHNRDILRHRWAGMFGTEREPSYQGRQHPTQKPVPLLEDIIKRYTKEGENILEPFLGSGTTLIAAERTNRTAYGCELSPHYCNIIIQRWQEHTGQQAIREVCYP